MSSLINKLFTVQNEHFSMNLTQIFQQLLMFLPVKNMMQHIESVLLIKFEKNYCRNKIHTLTVSKLWKRGSNRVKNRSHFTSELLDKLILRKSSVKIEIDLFALVFAFIKRVWFDGFQDELRPDLPSESVWYT